MAKDYDYPTYDAGGRVERYAEGGKTYPEKLEERFKSPKAKLMKSKPPKKKKEKKKKEKAKQPEYLNAPILQKNPFAPPKMLEKGGKVNKEVVKELRGKYYTDPKTGITDLGKSLETPWEAHLRQRGGKSKYFKNEKEFLEAKKNYVKK